MMEIKYVHGTPTSLNGCKVEIDGDVEYALIASRIAGFHGTVHLSGGQVRISVKSATCSV
jgi:hypothetical protein